MDWGRLNKNDYRVITRNALISFISAATVGVLLFAITQAPTNLDKPSGFWAYGFFAISALFLSPVIETAILAFLFHLFRQKLSNAVSGYLATLIFAIAHSLVSPTWGLIVAIPAVIFTWPFRAIGQGRLRDAMLRSGLTHALHNALALMAIAIFEIIGLV